MILNRQPLHTSSNSATAITTPSSPTQLSAIALFESLNPSDSLNNQTKPNAYILQPTRSLLPHRLAQMQVIAEEAEGFDQSEVFNSIRKNSNIPMQYPSNIQVLPVEMRSRLSNSNSRHPSNIYLSEEVMTSSINHSGLAIRKVEIQPFNSQIGSAIRYSGLMSPDNYSIQLMDRVGAIPSTIYNVENQGFGSVIENLPPPQVTMVSDIRNIPAMNIDQVVNSTGLTFPPPRQPSIIKSSPQQRAYPLFPIKENPQTSRKPMEIQNNFKFSKPRDTKPGSEETVNTQQSVETQASSHPKNNRMQITLPRYLGPQNVESQQDQPQQQTSGLGGLFACCTDTRPANNNRGW